MPPDYVPQADEPVGGAPILLTPSTFARHEKAVQSVEGANNSLYPRSPRGRTTHPARGAWGFLADGDSISAASGLSLGSGTVQLCSRDGGSLTADGPSVQVLNSGSSIAGPKSLSLGWTDGEFAVCECSSAPVDCVTCGGDMPTDLFVTDVLGTYTATWAGSRWITPVLCCPVTVGGGNIDGVADCVAGVPTCHPGLVSGDAAYRYVISCHSATELLISRNWLELYPACIQYAPCGCVDFLGGSNIAAIATVTCGAISASVTLGGGSSNLGDPLFKNNPGTNTDVSFSQ